MNACTHGSFAVLALFIITACGGEERPEPARPDPPSPPPPESPIAPRAVPRESPEFCQPLWNGLYERDGFVTPYGDDRRYEPTTLAAARGLLERAPHWVGAWRPGGASDEGRAYHRLRESPDALAHFEHLVEVGHGRVGALYGACGLAELDRGRYDEVLLTLRASGAEVSVVAGDVGGASMVSEVVGDGAFGRLFVSPGGFQTARRQDDFFSDDPGRMQIVASLDPFVPGGDASVRPIAARRVLQAIQHDARLSELIPPSEVFAPVWRANIEVRGDALEVALSLQARERFMVRFAVDADTGEARDVRETQW